MIWLLKYWRYAAGAALIGALLWGLHSYGQKRYSAGKASVQVVWDADRAAIASAANQAISEARAKEDAARANNEVIERDYQAKVASATAERDSTFRLLQQARNQVRLSAGREATSALIAATAGEASITERIDRVVAGVRAEGEANADQLDALIATVELQQ